MENKKTPTVVGNLALVMTLFSCSAFANSDRVVQQAADQAIVGLERQGYTGSVLVGRGDDLIYHRDSGVEKTADCVPSYWIASITKQFTAVGILLLHEREILKIQDSIAEYLPDVPADKSEITLFHLLTHTSGLEQQYAADGIIDRVEARKALLTPPLKTTPGEQFSYANDNYNLLAIILEISSGMTYEEFLSAEILLPAGMRNSGFWGMPVESGTCVPPVATQTDLQNMSASWGFRGATGMRASVRDLHAFMQALQSHDILAIESTAMLMGNHVTLSSGTKIGFNWFGRQSDQGISMKFSGGYESFGGNAVIYDYPDQGVTIITATNAGPPETGEGPVEGWSRKTHKALAEVFVGD